MKPVMPPQKLLEVFEGRAVAKEWGAPEGMEDSIQTAIGVRVDLGEEDIPNPVMFIMEFESHEEWKEFQKTRRLILTLPLGVVYPFSLNAYNVDLYREEVEQLNTGIGCGWSENEPLPLRPTRPSKRISENGQNN